MSELDVPFHRALQLTSLERRVAELNNTVKLEMAKRAELEAKHDSLRYDYDAMVKNTTERLGNMRQEIHELQQAMGRLKYPDTIPDYGYTTRNQPCDTIHDHETEQDG